MVSSVFSASTPHEAAGRAQPAWPSPPGKAGPSSSLAPGRAAWESAARGAGAPRRGSGDSMDRVKKALGRALRLLAAPVVLSGCAAFFVWHASHGERGLIAKEQRLADIAAARTELARATAEREGWERRVNALRGQTIDRDQLEERARGLLNLVQPGEVVIPYPPGQRLF